MIASVHRTKNIKKVNLLALKHDYAKVWHEAQYNPHNKYNCFK